MVIVRRLTCRGMHRSPRGRSGDPILKWARMGRARASIVSAIVLRDSHPPFAPRLSHVSRKVPALDAKNFDALVLGELLADCCLGKLGLSAHRAHRRGGYLFGQLHDLHGIVAITIPQIVRGDGDRADENQHRKHDQHSCDSIRHPNCEAGIYLIIRDRVLFEAGTAVFRSW